MSGLRVAGGALVSGVVPGRSEHRAERPLWTCAVDGLAWPCEAARHALRQQYSAADPLTLAVHLSYLMGVAADDLSVSDQAKLYRRFVAWSLPADRACRVCGRRGHDVLPGVPPRLAPWCDAHESLYGPNRAGTA